MDCFDYSQIPPHMMEGLKLYVEHGVPPGGFLCAVLSNELSEAVSRADDKNVWLLPIYMTWLYNKAPNGCWGSPECVKDWLARFVEVEAAPAAREAYIWSDAASGIGRDDCGL